MRFLFALKYLKREKILESICLSSVGWEEVVPLSEGVSF